MPETVELTITAVANGGEGVARLEDGRVAFVGGALPGERVVARLTHERARFVRAAILEVVDASTDRVAAPCPLVEAGCGGCGWQHVDLDAQRRLKAGIVLDAIRRGGGIEPPDPGFAPDLPATGWRTTVRATIDDSGRPAFRMHHSHDAVTLDATGCLVAHPLVDEVLRTAWFPPPVEEVTVRAGAATGERLVVARPAATGCDVPADTLLVGTDELAAGRRAWIHEVVAGRRWRISADSFFQGRPDGAEALVAVVAAVVGDALLPDARLVDLYGGVGLFAGALGAGTGGRVVMVENNQSAVADARVNLADLADARILRVDVRRWRPSPADVVVADPSRHGLGAGVVGRIGATGASALALVSCDAAALGRDAGLLAAGGWNLQSVTLVDLFPHTPHVEVVTGWKRPPA
ncbi:MAG: TRAM domain-containing protein [Actinomycetota bacterium]|nr:TRAM domain-containing protein [Actinomycetota bacterium]